MAAPAEEGWEAQARARGREVEEGRGWEEEGKARGAAWVLPLEYQVERAMEGAQEEGWGWGWVGLLVVRYCPQGCLQVGKVGREAFTGCLDRNTGQHGPRDAFARTRPHLWLVHASNEPLACMMQAPKPNSTSTREHTYTHRLLLRTRGRWGGSHLHNGRYHAPHLKTLS